MNPTNDSRRRPPTRPHRDEPGTLAEQLRAVAFYLRLDRQLRRRDPRGCWEAARWATIPHSRGVAR